MAASTTTKSLEVQIHPDRQRVVVAISGDLDMAGAGALRGTVDELRDAGWTDIVVDAGKLDFVDSHGLLALIDADHTALDEGWRFSVSRESAALRRMLGLTGLTHHFDRTAPRF